MIIHDTKLILKNQANKNRLEKTGRKPHKINKKQIEEP